MNGAQVRAARFLLVIASDFPALKGYSEVVRYNLPDNNRETVDVVPNMCGFKSTMRTHTPRDARREHRRCFRYKGGEWDA